jgi:hypothetical protein
MMKEPMMDMSRGSRVRHKTKNWIGTIHSKTKYGFLVNWSDEEGIRFRFARAGMLELIR